MGLGVVTAQRRFHIVFGREPPPKCQVASGINCLIRLAGFVQEEALGDNQSLKLRDEI
jgi:hypothetical protein